MLVGWFSANDRDDLNEAEMKFFDETFQEFWELGVGEVKEKLENHGFKREPEKESFANCFVAYSNELRILQVYERTEPVFLVLIGAGIVGMVIVAISIFKMWFGT